MAQNLCCFSTGNDQTASRIACSRDIENLTFFIRLLAWGPQGVSAHTA
jgi:hypothetical protein